MNEELKVIISAEISKLKQGVSDATKELGNLDKHKEKVNGNIKKLGNGIKTAMAAGKRGMVGYSVSGGIRLCHLDGLRAGHFRPVGLRRVGYSCA